uniref:ACD11 homolog protein n=1 Tax=Erigeron canadensis TaxID=72917 RepID=UPI001CB8BB83|nr:ACD11 homolog protein [Erigeron canadensis]
MALLSYFRDRERIRNMNVNGDRDHNKDDATQMQPQQERKTQTQTERKTETLQIEAQTPLSSIAKAFEEISDLIQKDKDVDLRLKPFCEACTHISVLFGCLGIAFKFAEMEYTAKVRDLLEASKNFNTLSTVVDHDLKNKTVKSPGSHTRNLRRVRQGLDLIRELFQNFLSAENHSLKKAATTAYQQVCAPYHTWAVRTAVSAGMCTLPTRGQLLMNLNETDKSAEKEMRRYIKASLDVIKTIDNLYIARGIKLDW